jgi:hypothetical protein
MRDQFVIRHATENKFWTLQGWSKSQELAVKFFDEKEARFYVARAHWFEGAKHFPVAAEKKTDEQVRGAAVTDYDPFTMKPT